MYELDALSLIASLVVTWTIGLLPPLAIRFGILKRPMGKGAAIGTCAFFWFFNVFLFTALGSQSRTHGALWLVAFVSYWILRKGRTSDEAVEEVVQASATMPDGKTPLMFAVITGKHDAVQALLDSGSNVNAADAQKWTALMFAVNCSDRDSIELLLARGADKTLRNADGHTAHDLAARRGHSDMATLLEIR